MSTPEEIELSRQSIQTAISNLNFLLDQILSTIQLEEEQEDPSQTLDEFYYHRDLLQPAIDSLDEALFQLEAY